jgi:hypothetical protein
MAGMMTLCSSLALFSFWTANRHVGQHAVMQSREA